MFGPNSSVVLLVSLPNHQKRGSSKQRHINFVFRRHGFVWPDTWFSHITRPDLPWSLACLGHQDLGSAHGVVQQGQRLPTPGPRRPVPPRGVVPPFQLAAVGGGTKGFRGRGGRHIEFVHFQSFLLAGKQRRRCHQVSPRGPS